MAKWAPLGLLLCLTCSSLLLLGGCALGSPSTVTPHNIQGTQGGGPSFIVVTLNTTEVFAFSSGKVTLMIVSDGNGVLVVNITNAEGAIIPASTQVAFTVLNPMYEVSFTAAWGALPGTFSLQVSAWYVNISNGNNLDPVLSGTVNARIGLGLTLGVPIFLAIGIIAIIMAVKIRKPAGMAKAETEKTESSAKSTGIASGVANKIHCPECKKLIDEGSVFCAECGARVPEFLRYNNPQA